MQQQRCPDGRFQGRTFEIKFQTVPDPELRAQLYDIRQRIFFQLGQLDLYGETIELSARDWNDVRGNVLGVAEGVVWDRDEYDVITIGIRNLVRSEVKRETQPAKKTRNHPEKPGEIRKCIQIATVLRVPAKGALSRKWPIWFDIHTRRYGYRRKGLYYKDEDGELLTQKQVRDWMRDVTGKKRGKR